MKKLKTVLQAVYVLLFFGGCALLFAGGLFLAGPG